MPLTVTYELFLWLRNTSSFYFREKSPEKHSLRVKKISDEIKDWVKNGRKIKMCTSRPGWQAMSLRAGRYKSSYKNIDLNLHEILEINESKQTVRVEPMCTMGQISYSLLPLGWTLPVVPELDDLTVGGLVAGVGIETSSHKFGLLQHICVSFEVVLPDGRYLFC
jgi:delta24-sterol reductase